MTDDAGAETASAAALRHLLDTQTIQRIFARYVPAIDSADGDVVAGDFVEDGIFDLGPIGVFRGRDEIRAFIARDHWPAENLARIARGGGHFLSAPLIAIDGDTAVATCTSLFFIREEGARAYVMERLTAVRLELVRRGDAWLITRRVNRLIDDSGEGVELYRQALADIADGVR